MTPGFPDISVLSAQESNLSPVERLVLAARVADVADLDPTQDGLVVYFTDWLSWIEWRRRGGRAVHGEAFLTAWPEELGEQDAFQCAAVTWMYESGRDATLFQGVSLGKQFNWEVTGVRLSAARLFASLQRALTALSPKAVEYRGLRAEYRFLDRESLIDLAEAAASEHGAPFSAERCKDSSGLDPELPFDGEFAPPPWRRRAILRAAELVIDGGSRLTSLFCRRAPRVYVLHNLLVVKSLIEHLPVGKVAPVLLARIYPKRPSFLLDAWRKGVRLVSLCEPCLDADAKRRLAEICSFIASFAASPAVDPADRAVRRFLQSHVLATGALKSKALEVLQFRRLFASEKPSRILVGDSENHMVRLACEVAQDLGVGVDELPNGMFLTGQRMDSRSGDGIRKPVIDRLLAWGEANLAWVKRAHISVPALVTGYPVADSLARSPAGPPANSGRALILPLHVDKTDLCGLYSEVFVNLIRAVEAARKAGYHDIRIKVHPGFIHLDYYQEVARRFGLDAQVFKDGSLLPHIEWADVVIGPINSGAMIEAAALGRRYIPVMNPPSALEPELARPAAPVMPEALEQTLRGPQENNEPALLAGIAGLKPGEPSGRRVWAAVLDGLSEKPCPTCA